MKTRKVISLMVCTGIRCALAILDAKPQPQETGAELIDRQRGNRKNLSTASDEWEDPTG